MGQGALEGRVGETGETAKVAVVVGSLKSSIVAVVMIVGPSLRRGVAEEELGSAEGGRRVTLIVHCRSSLSTM